MRKIFLTLLLVSSAALIVFVYFSLNRKKEFTGEPFSTVTPQCILSLEFTDVSMLKQLMPFAEKISITKNEPGGLLFNPISALFDLTTKIDSLYQHNEAWNNALKKSGFVFTSYDAVHSDSWALIIGVPNSTTPQDCQAWMGAWDNKLNFKERKFKEATLFESQFLVACLVNNCLLLSPSPSVIEECIIQSSKKNTLAHNEGFMAVRSTSSADSPLHIYAKMEEENWMSIDPIKGDDTFAGFAFIKPESTNGYTLAQRGGVCRAASVLPSATALFEAYSYESFEVGWKIHEDYGTGSAQAMFWNTAWKAYGDSCNCDLNDAALGWRDGEWGSSLSENGDSTVSEYYFIRSRDGSNPISRLTPLLADSTITPNGKIFTIRWPDIFSRNRNSFLQLETNFLAEVGEFIVMSDNQADLARLIAGNAIEGTLDKNPLFISAVAGFQPEGYFIYKKGNYIAPLPKSITCIFAFSKFICASVLPFKSDKWLVNLKTEGSLQHTRPATLSQEQGISMGWQTYCDEELIDGPWLIENHNTGQNEFLVMDKSHSIYQVGVDGKMQWKKKLDSEIVGCIHQLDGLKNGKLQMAFSTANSIYMIDRNGNDMPGFPIEISGGVVSPMRVFDYDKTKDYRLLVADGNHGLQNYSVIGVKAKGWNYESSKQDIAAFEHTRIGDEDLIITISTTGKIEILGRTGKQKSSTTANAEGFRGQYFSLIPANSADNTKIIFATKEGDVKSVTLKNKSNTVLVKGLSKEAKIYFVDINSDHKMDVLVADGPTLKVYDSTGEEIFNYSFRSGQVNKPTVQKSKSDVFIAVNTSDNEITLLNSKGKVSDGFPKRGYSRFAVSDLNNDGQMETIAILGNKLISIE